MNEESEEAFTKEDVETVKLFCNYLHQLISKTNANPETMFSEGYVYNKLLTFLKIINKEVSEQVEVIKEDKE